MIERNEENIRLVNAGREHIESIGAMYKAVIGHEGCAWNELYPSSVELNHDCETENLFVLIDGGEPLGAVSVVPEDELDDLDCWKVSDGTSCEIARVVVSPKCQGRGYARKMIILLIPFLLKRDIKSIHLLVSKKNQAAIKTYKSLGFDFLGECRRYETDFYICEKVLTEN